MFAIITKMRSTQREYTTKLGGLLESQEIQMEASIS